MSNMIGDNVLSETKDKSRALITVVGVAFIKILDLVAMSSRKAYA